MRFRSGKFWSAIGFSGVACALSLSPLAFLSPAYATIVVTLAGPPNGNFQPVASLPPNTPSGATTVYYPAQNTAQTGSGLSGTLDPHSGYTVLNFGDAAFTPGNYINLNVTSYISQFNNLGANQTAILVVTSPGLSTVQPAVTNEVIASNQNCPPSGNPCGDVAMYPSSGGSLYPRAFAIYPNTTVALAIDPIAICGYLNGAAYGCNQLISAAGTVTQMSLTFGVYILPAGTQLNNQNQSQAWNSSLPTGDTPVTVTFNFSTAPGSSSGAFTCNMGSAYYPGDGQIIVDGTQFFYPATTYSGTTPADGLQNVEVVYQEVNPPPASPPALSTSEMISPSATNVATQVASNVYTESTAGLGPNNVIAPFINSTSTQSVYYALGFIGEDNYGFLVQGADANGVSAGSCAYTTGVQTASITTLLNSSKCFIATATFRSMDSPPLILLRAFRDHFLEHFGLGRAFVHWYYAWSPGAADWLVANPVFRFPIFLALIPLQILAWLVLHPLELLLLCMLAFSVLGYALTIRKKELRG